MANSIQRTLDEFVQSLDFNEADDLLLDEISVVLKAHLILLAFIKGYNSNVKFEKVISELPNGGKIVEIESGFQRMRFCSRWVVWGFTWLAYQSSKPLSVDDNDETLDDSAPWNEEEDDQHYQQEKVFCWMKVYQHFAPTWW